MSIYVLCAQPQLPSPPPVCPEDWKVCCRIWCKLDPERKIETVWEKCGAKGVAESGTWREPLSMSSIVQGGAAPTFWQPQQKAFRNWNMKSAHIIKSSVLLLRQTTGKCWRSCNKSQMTSRFRFGYWPLKKDEVFLTREWRRLQTNNWISYF